MWADVNETEYNILPYVMVVKFITFLEGYFLFPM